MLKLGTYAYNKIQTHLFFDQTFITGGECWLNYFIARLFICLFTLAHLLVLISAARVQSLSTRLTDSILGFFPLLGKIEAHFRLGFCLVVSVLMILPLIFSGLSNYANAATYDASGQWADFSNVADVGLSPTVGDTYTYANIFAGVDALVTVIATQKTGTGLKAVSYTHLRAHET